MLFSSGLIAGGAVTGMILALIQLGAPGRAFMEWINVSGRFPLSGSDLFSILLFLGLAAVLWAVASERWLAGKDAS